MKRVVALLFSLPLFADVTLVPITLVPITLVPITLVPITLVPITLVPITLVPITLVPITLVPITLVPITLVPITLVPITLVPITLVPINEAGFQRLVAAHQGKVVVYDFWATWCAPCRAELPQLEKLEAKLRSQGVEVITISADEPDQKVAAGKFIQKFGVQGPAYIKQADNDDRFINAIDPKWGGALPALFVYDKAGHKVRSFVGETDMAKVEAAVRRLL